MKGLATHPMMGRRREGELNVVTVGRVVRGHVDFEVIIILIITENKKQAHTRTESKKEREGDRVRGPKGIFWVFNYKLLRIEMKYVPSTSSHSVPPPLTHFLTVLAFKWLKMYLENWKMLSSLLLLHFAIFAT